MESTQNNIPDGILDIILKTALEVNGVAHATVKRTESGYQLKVVPKSGIDIRILREAIRSAAKERVPLLAGDILISVEPEKIIESGALSKSESKIGLVCADITSVGKGQFTILVRLKRTVMSSPEVNETECTKSGAYLTENVIRLSAETALHAALELLPEVVSGAVIGTKFLELCEKNLVVVLLTLILNEGTVSVSGSSCIQETVSVSGSACIRDEVHLASVIATLRAINRYLESGNP
ncbi:MAG: hypothetical protein JSV84_13225 [Gemmatimonadota bacterium]|nr:MAG: hypothetical protein JSV84_13225 [Gemmatimonadota bacterium]